MSRSTALERTSRRRKRTRRRDTVRSTVDTTLSAGGDESPQRLLDAMLDRFEDWPDDAKLRITIVVSRELPEPRT